MHQKRQASGNIETSYGTRVGRPMIQDAAINKTDDDAVGIHARFVVILQPVADFRRYGESELD